MADDSFVAGTQRHEAHYFRCDARCEVTVPRGSAELAAWRGLEARPIHRSVTLDADRSSVTLALEPIRLPARFGDFVSADLHVHMNYGGHYKLTPAALAADARAEDLDVVYNLIVNKEERIPDVAQFTAEPQRFDDVVIYQSQETHTSYWGHLGLLHLRDHVVLPDFASYQPTALASPYPHNGVLADLAHEQGALVGYVHPFDDSIGDLARLPKLSHALPVDVALGKVDYIEIVSFADPAATAAVWHRLLNLGFRVPAGAGTDAMANYASLRGPVGVNRTYLAGTDTSPQALLQAIKTGRGFVTNAPLLGLTVEGVGPGQQVELRAGGHSLHVQAAMRSIVPMSDVELVHNGRIIKRLRLREGGRSAQFSGTLDIDAAGWILLRARNRDAQPDVQDFYPYGTTNPVWLNAEAGLPPAPQDAQYFLRWLDMVIASATARDDYNSRAEREATLNYLGAARRVYEELARRGSRTSPALAHEQLSSGRRP
jgi:hypothetical protein